MMPGTKRITGKCLITAMLLVAAGGCAQTDQNIARVDAQPIEASSFRDLDKPRPDRTASKPKPIAMQPLEPSPSETIALVGGPDQTPLALENATTRSGLPTRSERLIVDRMVGQINGRPIYASEFFKDMDARLRAEVAKLEPREWIIFASQNIDKELADRLRNELLLAEFQSALSPEQRQGVLGFLAYIRENIRRQSGGSEARATERLLRTEGLTLDEKVEQQKEQQFIFEQVRREVNSHINISYRDIKRRFEQDREKYATTAEAALCVIRVRASNVDAISAVTDALARGESPLEIANEHGTFKSAERGLHRVELDDAGYRTTKIFDPPELDNPARELSIGQISAPIEYRNSVWWIHLEDIHLPEQVTLYDMQLQIERQIQLERQIEEERKYFIELAGNSSFSDTAAMKRELLEFAADRYLILQPQMDEAHDGTEN